MSKKHMIVKLAAVFTPILFCAQLARASYMDAVVSLDPVGYWSFGEASGTTAVDLSVNDLDGTYHPQVTLGQVGAIIGDSDTSALFDGSSGYFHVGAAAQLAIDGDLTIAFWLNTELLSGAQALITYTANGETPSMNTLYEVTLGGDGYLSYRHEKAGGTDYAHTFTGQALLPGSWYLVTVTRDSSRKEVNLFVDDNLVGTYAAGQNPNNGSASSLYIGSNLGSNQFFHGRIDEVAVFDRMLSAAEMQGMYQAGTTALPAPELPTCMFLAVGSVMVCLRRRLGMGY
jgi:hypothetical protein